MDSGDTTLDLRGEMCPYPLDETKRVMRTLPSGATISVLVDCPESVGNLSRWARHAGHEVLATNELQPAEWDVQLRRR